ncbi:2,3-dihydro-2,3-dihydroxybenzoate dehydrogenase [Streptosporangium canum]|uniref:2,3-dihydro-2,3-dihydroxybenzoate dehydrogenase n=1 Tax=Streptosporangium canum TaxID=324952 RepID=UPI0037BA639E
MPTITASAATTSDGIAGRVAVVTGAAQGIGAATCAALSACGAKVAAMDVRADLLRHLADNLVGTQPFVTDVRDGPAVEASISAVEREIGPIDILVNVAGTLHTGAAIELTDEAWRQAFAVNADGVFHTARAVARRMITRRSGVIVTVASNAANVPRTHMAAYAASKAAAVMLTRCLGLELGPLGIRANIVSPGSTDTAMQRQLWTEPDGAETVIRGSLERFRTGIPLGRIAEASDVADAVVFLASNRARHITLQELIVDGGASLR